MFSFGSIATFPIIQQDMRRPEKFHLSAWLSYTSRSIFCQRDKLIAKKGDYFSYFNDVVDSLVPGIFYFWEQITEKCFTQYNF